jgi:DNA-binding response OmpR family regulator
LIVEDEYDLRDAMVTYLSLEGFVCAGVASLAAADTWLQTHAHDILVLDLGLPDGDGLQWLAARPQLRQKGVIITTARGLGAERIAGAKAGADAYLVKPVQLEELAPLAENLALRLGASTPCKWLLDATVWTLAGPDGCSIKLTHSESAIVHRIALSPGCPISRDELVRHLGLNPQHYDERRMEITIRRLRTKAQAQLGYALPLETVYKQGYAFTAPIEIRTGAP